MNVNAYGWPRRRFRANKYSMLGPSGLQLGGQYLGDRNSIRNLIVPFSEYKAGNIVTAKSLGSIILLASSLTWKINEQWDLFYENKIILGDSTSRWAYYQNQSQLHLGGIRYKFDLNL